LLTGPIPACTSWSSPERRAARQPAQGIQVIATYTYRHFKADFPARPPVSSAGISTVPPLANSREGPQPAAVRRSAGEIDTGVGRPWCPSTLPSSAHPVRAGEGGRSPGAPCLAHPGGGDWWWGCGRRWGRVGGQAVGSVAGEGVGGRLHRQEHPLEPRPALAGPCAAVHHCRRDRYCSQSALDEPDGALWQALLTERHPLTGKLIHDRPLRPF
jgi:hypothetical protein